MMTELTAHEKEIAVEKEYLPSISFENGMCTLTMPYSKYSVKWPESRIHEMKIYRCEEDVTEKVRNNALFDIIMGTAMLRYELNNQTS